MCCQPMTSNTRLRVCAVVLIFLAASALANAGTETVLYRFQGGNDGYLPADLISDAKGNLFGTTGLGGTGPCTDPFTGAVVGCGTVYELSPPTVSGGAWTHTILYDFPNGTSGIANDGVGAGNLLFDSTGNLYLTTESGGASNYGTVFQLAPPTVSGGSWTATVIADFTSLADGAVPNGLVIDHAGNLYGTTSSGGAYLGGVVFELTPPSTSGGAWTKTTLYSFKGGPNIGVGDGAEPQGLTLDATGNIYGGTNWGGICQGEGGCYGVIFKLTKPATSGGAWTEKVLYRFPNAEGTPDAGLVVDKAGNIYGTGYGGVIQLTIVGGKWTLNYLHLFNGQNSDGNGTFGGVTLDKFGNVYGTTEVGGTLNDGIVFELSPPAVSGGAWTENILYNFAGGSDGIAPFFRVIFRRGNTLYGTTGIGGNQGCVNYSEVGCGTVFAVVP
jgi:hypothetical protein